MRAAVILSLLYLAATAAILELAGCVAVKQDAKECFRLDDCGSDEICFMGQCQTPGFAIQNVFIELQPPSSSAYLSQHTPGAVDLASGYQTITLLEAVSVTGKILGDEAAATGTLVATSDGSIPGRKLQRQAKVEAGLGYNLRVVPGVHSLKYTPDAVSAIDSPRPPRVYAGQGITAAAAGSPFDLPYWTSSELVSLRGRLRASTSVGSAVSGAVVSATALTSTGESLSSSTSVTDDNGEYRLMFPPGATAITVKVQSGSPSLRMLASAQNPCVPEVSVPVARRADDPTRLEDIVLGLSVPEFTVLPALRGSDGLKVANAVIVFDGTVGTLRGKFVTKVESDENGDVPATKLLPGDYRVSVAPGTAQPYALSSTELKIEAAGQRIELSVGLKARFAGTVLASDGTPVAAARLTLSRRDAPVPREFSTDTDSDGRFAIAVDPALAGEGAKYELIVEPERASGLPRHRQFVLVGPGGLESEIRLNPATFVYGRVLTPLGEAPVAEVTVAIYSLDLSSEPLLLSSEPLLVGLGLTSSKGEFAVPLPTLPR